MTDQHAEYGRWTEDALARLTLICGRRKGGHRPDSRPGQSGRCGDCGVALDFNWKW